MWLMCTVITTIYGRGKPSHVAINMSTVNTPIYGGGEPSHVGSCVAINVHR